jgi:hypothetical protein
MHSDEVELCSELKGGNEYTTCMLTNLPRSYLQSVEYCTGVRAYVVALAETHLDTYT